MANPGRPKVVVIAGPTASGKTAAALALAKRLDGELIGADSVQVYRGFDIGSAKPSPAELGGLRHHLIDVVNPDAHLDAADYATLADDAISAVAARGKIPIVVGGTGLWLRALLRGLVPVPKVDPALRARVESEVRSLGPERAHARLSQIDPLAAAAIHPNDELRIVRALEVYEQTGQPMGELRRQHALGSPRYEAFELVLAPDMEALTERLDLRLQAMLDAGWLDEIRALLAAWGPRVRAMGSVGYRQLIPHITEAQPLEEAVAAARKATRVYARRQRTWFRGEPGMERTSDTAAITQGAHDDAIAAFLGRGA